MPASTSLPEISLRRKAEWRGGGGEAEEGEIRNTNFSLQWLQVFSVPQVLDSSHRLTFFLVISVFDSGEFFCFFVCLFCCCCFFW